MLDIAQDQESTGAALGLPHPHWIHPDTEFGVWRAGSPFFFYLCWFGLKLVDSARFQQKQEPILLISAKTATEIGRYGQNGRRNSRQNGQLAAILLLHVALWEEGKKKKKGRRRWPAMNFFFGWRAAIKFPTCFCFVYKVGHFHTIKSGFFYYQI